MRTNDEKPMRVNKSFAETHDFADIKDPKQREGMKEWARRMASGRPFIRREDLSANFRVLNADASRCFNCSEIAVWIFDQMVWPRQGVAPLPNPDTPEDIRRDYEEASTILDLSPRGAAALLRLAVQKLCAHPRHASMAARLQHRKAALRTERKAAPEPHQKGQCPWQPQLERIPLARARVTRSRP
jgi:hypothetical protein